jgi:carbonic anhydrase
LDKLTHLFENNHAWSEAARKKDPNYFARSADEQHPGYLWIACSDSRVSPDRIVDLPPGELFVHRNIANLVIHEDLNCMSALQFAVEVLKIEHIVICGHYNCGGIRAALDGAQEKLVDHWLQNIKQVINSSEKELAGLSFKEKYQRLCELNVIQQVYNLCTTNVISNAWNNNRKISIYGIIYSPHNGRLKNLEVNLDSKQAFKNYFGEE